MKNARKIDKILKQLTPERIKKELAAIQAVEYYYDDLSLADKTRYGR